MSTVRVKDLIKFLDDLAPFRLQESYDNSGLNTGNPENEVTGVLVTLDCTEEVIQEAVLNGCNVILAHHPVIFSPLKSLTGKSHVERTIINAIRNNISIVAIHTNFDNIKDGVNKTIADRLGLINRKVLRPIQGNIFTLVTHVPESHSGLVLNALHDAGAGKIGNYSHCSFRSEGTGSYLPENEAQPWQGTKGNLEQVSEVRLEVLVPSYRSEAILAALFKSHPYEEVSYNLTQTINQNQETGAGLVGELINPVPAEQFLRQLKGTMKTGLIRHSPLCHKEIARIAVCGGSGSFLLKDAIESGSEVFITADFRYHDFFGAEGKIIIADIGHFESEQYTKELLTDVLRKKFTNFAVVLSKIDTNPISYL
ncbi:MAG: Nif3-like dinuclear metal center hexameric protein [Cyclobacteriaceae bacterium]